MPGVTCQTFKAKLSLAGKPDDFRAWKATAEPETAAQPMSIHARNSSLWAADMFEPTMHGLWIDVRVMDGGEGIGLVAPAFSR